MSLDKYMSSAFQFAIEVFQGCVLSSVLFKICLQPLLYMQHESASEKGWSNSFSQNAQISRDASAYAGDLELYTWSLSAGQIILNLTQDYLS